MPTLLYGNCCSCALLMLLSISPNELGYCYRTVLFCTFVDMITQQRSNMSECDQHRLGDSLVSNLELKGS